MNIILNITLNITLNILLETGQDTRFVNVLHLISSKLEVLRFLELLS